MSPASPSVPSPDLLPQWKKRKRPDSSTSSAAAAAGEVLPDSVPISTFPAALRRTLARPPPSLFSPRSLDNLSHGQLLSLSAVPPDDLFVCSPPPLLPSKGLLTHFRSLPLLLPVHAAWFSPDSVHRIERQVVPHFFSAKSPEQTPDRYILLRNTIISKYLEDPGRRLSYADCQGFVGAAERYDLSRIVRFLDHWGIINYMAASMHSGLRTKPSLLKEDGGGELVLQTGPLRSIDSLVLFDRPKCSLSVEEVGAVGGGESGWEDLDTRIRERLSEFSCSCCSCPLPGLHYQSQKEGDVIICSNCFHDGKFVTGHSSVDFVRVDSKKDTTDLDGDNWTDQETFLLLEAVEKYNDNWNEIAEHVGTKSKAQCILHFLRLPMEDSVLERLEIPQVAVSADCSKEQNPGLSCSNSNGDAAGFGLESSDPAKQLPFANSTNPVMSLVAFLASAVGPRVAAACASAALLVLTKGDTRLNSESIHTEVGTYGEHANHRKDETSEDQVSYTKKDAPLAIEHVKLAAMSGLSAAAMKSKLFADQEEREVQRLSATIITHQLKRLELKLKQFAEVETLLMKECEQVDRNRQRFSTERVRLMSSKLAGATGTMLAAAPGVSSAAPASTSTRQTTMPSSVGQAYGNNFPVQQQMPFVQRQQQMFGYGPRLPLSAIHPSPPASSPNVIFGSGDR